MSRQGEPRTTRSFAAAALSTGNKGNKRGRRSHTASIARGKEVAALKAQLAFLNAMVADFQDKLEAQAQATLPGKYEGRLMRTAESFAKPMSTSRQGVGVGVDQATGISLPGSTTPGGDEQPGGAITQGGSANTDSSSGTDSANADVSRETSTGNDTAPASVPSALDGYEKRLEAMGLRVPVPVVPDEIWQFLEGAEGIEDGHLRLQKYQAAMRAFGRYYTQIGEVDRGFQVCLMLTNQMKDMYMARSKSAGGYLVRESELAALEAEISGMSDEELAAEEEKGETDKDS